MTTDHRNNPLIMPMFVYGTLLPGHYNHELVEDDYVHVDQGVVIAGQLFWAHTEGSYPVAKVDLPDGSWAPSCGSTSSPTASTTPP
jgi:gamma-glutamylcyclotransferase (GGCT)/AIG2-like uncharacterized protein YtfP